MPFYKDLQNKVHVLDSAEFEHLLPPGCAPISEDEADALNRPAALSAEDQIKYQIMAIEASITPRRFREAVLGIDSGWLANKNSEISALRAQLS